MNKRIIFDYFIDIIKKDFESKESNKEEYGNIYIYFSSDTCSKYFNFLKMLFTLETDTSLLYDILMNYFRDKFKSDNGGEEELINIVNEFTLNISGLFDLLNNK